MKHNPHICMPLENHLCHSPHVACTPTPWPVPTPHSGPSPSMLWVTCTVHHWLHTIVHANTTPCAIVHFACNLMPCLHHTLHPHTLRTPSSMPCVSCAICPWLHALVCTCASFPHPHT